MYRVTRSWSKWFSISGWLRPSHHPPLASDSTTASDLGPELSSAWTPPVAPDLSGPAQVMPIPPPSTAAIILTPQERSRLVSIVATLHDFADGAERARKRMIDEAGLTTILQGIDVRGPQQDVAWEIVGRLATYGWLPSRPKY